MQAYLGPTASSQIHAHNQIFYKDALKQTSVEPLAFTKTHHSTESIQGGSQTCFSLSTLQPEPQSSPKAGWWKAAGPQPGRSHRGCAASQSPAAL